MPRSYYVKISTTRHCPLLVGGVLTLQSYNFPTKGDALAWADAMRPENEGARFDFHEDEVFGPDARPEDHAGPTLDTRDAAGYTS